METEKKKKDQEKEEKEKKEKTGSYSQRFYNPIVEMNTPSPN